MTEEKGIGRGTGGGRSFGGRGKRVGREETCRGTGFRQPGEKYIDRQGNREGMGQNTEQGTD